MSHGTTQSVKWGFFGLVAGILVWRIVALGVADYYADSGSASASALAWYPNHPQALYQQAYELLESNPALAEQLLRKAVRANPTDGRIYMALARIRAHDEEAQKAAELVTIASYLAPMRGLVQLEAAVFWSHQGWLDRALMHWSRTLALLPELDGAVYPTLLRMAAHPETQPLFVELLADPPAWWGHFFNYAVGHADTLETVRVLYQLRRQNGRKASVSERQHYLMRLETEQQWPDMYFAWINGLDDEQLTHLGNIYNGEFELAFAGEGFGWRSVKGAGSVRIARTYGAEGKALHLRFNKQRDRFRHLSQLLLLSPGNYRLVGRVRPDGLLTENGLQWLVRCHADDERVLGASERFVGTDQWRNFGLDFEVPAENCPIQEIRLEMMGRYEDEFAAVGGVWFDDLRIRRMN